MEKRTSDQTGGPRRKRSKLSRIKTSSTSSEDEIQAQESTHDPEGAATKTVSRPTTDSIPQETPTGEVELDEKSSTSHFATGIAAHKSLDRSSLNDNILLKEVNEQEKDGPSNAGAGSTTSECAKEEHHLQEGQQSIEGLMKDDKGVKMASKPTTATVYLAAPTGQTLAFVGDDIGWTNPQTTFELVKEIEPDFGIFRGVIPVPSRKSSSFKFAVVESNGNIKYEGSSFWDNCDNRWDELQMDSVYYFIFKPRTNNMFYELVDVSNDTCAETRKEIMVEFLSLIYDRALENVPTNWDAAFDILSDGMQKLRRLLCNEFCDGFKKFVFERLQLPLNFEHIFLMVVGIHMNKWTPYYIFPNDLIEILQIHADPFSRYLFEFSGKVERNKALKNRVFAETLAIQGGPDYWWIIFRLNRHNEYLKDVEPKKVEDAMIKTLTVFPEPLISHETVVARVVNFLLFRCDDLDGVYDRLLPVLEKSFLDRLLLKSVPVFNKNLTDLTKILCSKFLKGLSQQEPTDGSDSSILNQDSLKSFFSSLFDRQLPDDRFADIIQLACCIPDYFLGLVMPIAEAAVKRKMEALRYLNAEDLKCYYNLQPSLLIKFPLIQKMMDDAFLRITIQQLSFGSISNIPSLDLILRGLAKRLDNVPFLKRPLLSDLQISVAKLPRNYFKDLHSAVKFKYLGAHRKGETKQVVAAIERHFELVDEIVVQVRSRLISIKDAQILQDPHLADYLKYVGLEERVLSNIRQQVEELRKLYELYSGLYKNFGRLNLVQTSSSTSAVNVNLANEENRMGNSGEEEMQVGYKAVEPIQVLDPKDWTTYLIIINNQSDLLLQYALSLPTPAVCAEAVWLDKVKDCPLFSEMIWYSSVRNVTSTPLSRGDLSLLIQECAGRWLTLAQRICDGNVPFEEMEKVVRLQPDPKLLAQAHLQYDHLHRYFPATVNKSYRDFKILQKLQQSIGSFINSLRLFKINRREEIGALKDFFNDNLLQNWTQFTLEQVRESGITETIMSALQIDLEKPETMSPLELIASLITNKSDGSSPLVEWLRKKKPQDMEAMGKILQGTLLEAYGQLQTLRTRIAPFLDQEFESYQDLLNAVRETEQKFAKKIGSRVQPIKCTWLANMLPEIDAAVRASVISPAVEAKEILGKLSRVILDVQDEDDYKIEIELEQTGSLSIDELKQAFQLLDMSTTDDTDASTKMRKSVGLILRLAEVFAALFDCGSITYSLQSKKTITMENLDQEILEMQRQLSIWNELWEEVEQLPLLALFSRSYLLHLADLIRKREALQVISILRMLLPSANEKLQECIDQLVLLVHEAIQINGDEDASIITEQLLYILRQLHDLIQLVYFEKGVGLNLPTFLTSFGRSLRSHFIDKSVEILNVSKDLVAGSALAAYISFTGRRVEPSRILFVTASTSEEEVKRFMTIWSLPDHPPDEIFIIVHIERLTASSAGVVRDAVGLVLPEKQTKLLLLAQQNNRVSATRSLGARLGLVSDRSLDINFTAGELSECLCNLLPETSKMFFFSSKLPGCGKSQQVLQLAAKLPRPDYYRIPIRLGTVEELLDGVKKVKRNYRKNGTSLIHLDVAHSASLEFNDLLLSLLINGALYNPNQAKLGFWSISNRTTIAIEFASPFGAKEFPVIGYLGQHSICDCTATTFNYELAAMPLVIGQKVVVSIVPRIALVVAGKFLRIKQAGAEGLAQWNSFCTQPDTITEDPLPKEETFRYLVEAFHHADNRQAPTFSALNAMASFIHRHISVMMKSMWFNESAIFLFEEGNEAEDDSDDHDDHDPHEDDDDDHHPFVRIFKTNVFDLLLRVANDSVTRSWSILHIGQKQPEMDWIHRQRALFLLGLNEDGQFMGMNIVGRDEAALKAMFHRALLPYLEAQCLKFQELKGFKNLLQSPEGAQLIINAMRSLLLLDGTASSAAKVLKLDSHPRNTPAIQILHELIGTDFGYALTGDNITKMMFALYRIRCGLPVIVFGEAGVGKTALFRFLIQSLLGHEFQVCNVNSGTTIYDVAAMVEEALKKLANEAKTQVFLLFDEMNTADSVVIAFLKELMLDRHFNGTVLPENLHIMAAANPYRSLKESDKEAAVGLAFRFAPNGIRDSNSSTLDNRNLVYRVNELPLSFYDHIYDFGHLCDEAESTYIEEICQHLLPKFSSGIVQDFVALIRKSHQAARAMSPDPDSAVSLRDTTRAAQLFRWFCETPAGKSLAYSPRIAVELSIYLVYAFRFKDRTLFLENVFGINQSASRSMMEASRKIANTLYEEVHGASIGSGAIALNEALCENLFALYVCVLNGIFLIIVGRPGSSKSLSVEILKLVLSPGNHTLRQKLGDIPAITELYFQCSPMSTSSGFKALFESAHRLNTDPKTMLAMVVLDELGLADLSPERPMKVLHSELERKAVLTSGEQQRSPCSVVALSNWVVDAAQLNRGILISRTQAKSDDLLLSSVQLAETLILKYSRDTTNITNRLREKLSTYLKCIVHTYEMLNSNTLIGGDHFFSMRDFFFCVKNFICSILQTTQQGLMGVDNLIISDHHLIQSIVRNFGGHDHAQQVVRQYWATWINVDVATIPPLPPLDLIVQNINDSSKELSVHIARHLMILNRSMIGLQLLNHHVKHRLNEGLGWNVIFGSCFPGDLQVMAVTRKLRQVEQAIRSGGVLILCHAEQLFESLYMVLNQQYWAQDDVMMTQIALGPSSRAIVLSDGPFRIIALQDIDTALNPNLMSPAVLSRFEKHELRPSHLLNEVGGNHLALIQSHPVWMAVPELVKRKRLLYGYHEESFATLALHLQESNDPMEVDGEIENNLHVQWMRAVNPMAMIKLEHDARNNEELMDICRHYRKDCILEGIDDAMDKMSSSRQIVIMTNTLRHLEVSPRHVQSFVIRLFDIQTELELHSMLDSVKKEDRNNPEYCIFIQHDAISGPIEQFQITKYEIETRMEGAKCRIVFIVHVDPRPSNMHWAFSFGDGWDYAFVDELVSIDQSCPADHRRVPLSELVNSPVDRSMAEFIEPMTEEAFRSLLLEMLGPNLQTSLSHLRYSLGPFYSGVRGALGLPDNQRLIRILKECLVAQLKYNRITWNVVNVVTDPNFDSSSSLTEGLWGAYKTKISVPLAHLLLTSDVSKVSNLGTMSLWCSFVDANYPDRLMLLNSNEPFVPIPVGFRFCSQPFGRLLACFDAVNQDPNVNGALRWLFNNIEQSEDAVYLKKIYFRDWLLLHVPPHLHSCLELLPLENMLDIVNALFEDQQTFFQEWKHYEADVVAALELVRITMYASTEEFPWNTGFGNIRNWNEFSKSAVLLSMTVLANPDVIHHNQKKWIQSISTIEISTALGDFLDRVEDVSQLMLGLRITKRMVLFNPNCQVKLPELLGSSVEQLIENLTELLLNSIIHPRLTTDGENRRVICQTDLYLTSLYIVPYLLNIAAVCTSSEELFKKLRSCPITNSLVPFEAEQRTGRCPCCDRRLLTRVVAAEEVAGADVGFIHHLVEPDIAAVKSLFQDHLKFLFFFERVAELFIHHQRNHPDKVREFLNHLLVERTHLRVSWRFLIVVLKSVLSTRSGSATIDSLLETIPCNASFRELNSNTQSFLRALLARADEEVRTHSKQERPALIASEDWNQAIMTNKWTVERIRRLAVIREALDSGQSQAADDALNEWTHLRRNNHNSVTTEAFLFFVLNFSSGRGDETRLRAVFARHQDNQELGSHPIIRPYMFKLISPLSLGFDLLPVGMRTQRLEKRLSNRLPLDDILPHYHLLQEFEQDWAPYIALLALHAADIAEHKKISFLRELVINPSLAAQSYLPGIDNHPCMFSFMEEGARWYICLCGTPNYVGNCGQPTHQSICINCHEALSIKDHEPRPGVRRANEADFQPPKGLTTSRIPSQLPNFTVRKKPPIVTRFCLLLNYLALMNAALDSRTSPQVFTQLMGSLDVGQHQQQEDRQSFIRFLASQIIVHLDLLCQLLVSNRLRLTRPDQFRIGHFILHKLLNFQNLALRVNAQQFVDNPQIRDAYENGLAQLLSQQYNFEIQLDRIEQSDEMSRVFRRSLTESQAYHWAYADLVSSNRTSLQLILARDERLRQRYPFLNLLLDENWSKKLDALQHLGDAIRFIALVRTVLQGNITLNEVNRMTIDQGLSKMIEVVEQKAVLLDRGRAVTTREHVNQLFKSFKLLWDHFSQIPNSEHNTFLDHFECQEVNLNIRPRTILDENAPLILILAGTGLPETSFAYQLLSHAVETAASIAQITFVQPSCSAKSGRVQLSVSNATALADFDDSLFAHVSAQEVDEFISDHVIDQDTLGLAESFAMSAVLGPSGSIIVQDLSLEIVGDFYFKDNPESETFLSSLERRFLAWQPTGITVDILNRIVGDLEKNRSLAEVKAVLLSAIIHLDSNTDPLEIARMRQSPISGILQGMERAGILTEQHLSDTTISVLNRYIIEVRHAFCLLKGIISRMRDDNIFGGRVPTGWDSQLDERTAELTRMKMRAYGGNIVDTLLQMVNIVSSPQTVPEMLLPEKSLLFAIREIEGTDWNGIQMELKMKHLGHVLLLAEALQEE